MPTITAEQFKAPPLRRAEVYLDRFGGSCTLQELTGDQVVLAAQWSKEIAPGTEGITHFNAAKQKRLHIACGLVEPKLEGSEVVRAEVLRAWPIIEQNLLAAVIYLLDAGALTEEHLVMLAAEGPAHEKYEALGLPKMPEEAIDLILLGEEAELTCKVALCIPAVLGGDWPMTHIRILAEAVDRQQESLAEAIARKLTEAGSG